MRRPNNPQPALEKADFPRRKSGRVAFEEDGRSIWEWQTATGVFERNATADQVAQLEDTTLSIAEDPEPTGTSIYTTSTTVKVSGLARGTAKQGAIEKPTVLSRLLKRFG